MESNDSKEVYGCTVQLLVPDALPKRISIHEGRVFELHYIYENRYHMLHVELVSGPTFSSLIKSKKQNPNSTPPLVRVQYVRDENEYTEAQAVKQAHHDMIKQAITALEKATKSRRALENEDKMDADLFDAASRVKRITIELNRLRDTEELEYVHHTTTLSWMCVAGRPYTLQGAPGVPELLVYTGTPDSTPVNPNRDIQRERNTTFVWSYRDLTRDQPDALERDEYLYGEGIEDFQRDSPGEFGAGEALGVEDSEVEDDEYEREKQMQRIRERMAWQQEEKEKETDIYNLYLKYIVDEKTLHIRGLLELIFKHVGSSTMEYYLEYLKKGNVFAPGLDVTFCMNNCYTVCMHRVVHLIRKYKIAVHDLTDFHCAEIDATSREVKKIIDDTRHELLERDQIFSH